MAITDTYKLLSDEELVAKYHSGDEKAADYLIEKYKNHKILEFVDYITLSIMDGSIVKYDRQSDYYKLVMSFIVIPSKIFKKNVDFKKLIFAVDAVLTGGRYNNQHDTL